MDRKVILGICCFLFILSACLFAKILFFPGDNSENQIQQTTNNYPTTDVSDNKLVSIESELDIQECLNGGFFKQIKKILILFF